MDKHLDLLLLAGQLFFERGDRALVTAALFVQPVDHPFHLFLTHRWHPGTSATYEKNRIHPSGESIVARQMGRVTFERTTLRWAYQILTFVLFRFDAYLMAGGRLVWAVYPDDKVVEVYRLAQEGTSLNVQTFGIEESLDGGDVLPGFTLTLKDLFAVPD